MGTNRIIVRPPKFNLIPLTVANSTQKNGIKLQISYNHKLLEIEYYDDEDGWI